MKTIFEKSNGTDGINLTDEKINIDFLPKNLCRTADTNLPQLSELDVMRHYKELSDLNFCIEQGFYPLGSCTMKYNPKVNELLASLDGFNIHPNVSDDMAQGALKLMYNLQSSLLKITGMDAITLKPSAGAHGEMTGMMIIRKYFDSIGEKRTKVIIPDSAHGTNPASAKMSGFDIVEIKSNEKGQVDIDALKSVLDRDVAAIMMTNPNTLGIFEENVEEISRLMHENGSLLYYDGANFNAIMGYTNPKLMGFDVVHLNLHKTFSTPHGGGGPGAGPVAVVEKLKDYLPTPIVDFDGEKYFRNYDLKNSIGSVKDFYGNFSVLVKAYAYILMMGKNLKHASENAVLNANYLKEKLKKYYDLPYDEPCMHEFVLSGERQKHESGVSTLNIAKALMDGNTHPPTVYFPLIVHEAIMIEPTESEHKEMLDDFVETMIQIAQKAKENPEEILSAPHTTPVKKIDEVQAARHPDLKYTD
ncbi:MAG: aminomethyl-transferring glycine dehydrogenase subunit GcvPB [Candidatus Gastranaerophilaceae bacterium]|nr:probable glycine dehydrogenase [decarboxylating] subunit 2 [Fusobacterium sp. CAG:815]DAA89781.1 MAG TPA: glycine dehydrogenase (aminomethyl-transferring) [Candidatus Gastranaerophilales bacterium HUM_6]DAA91552.1 MAG TPA: glycine dehydrogenase (aminomethyl-transferring) [Candidatus Gastranaerophilales bacterium HUM_7]DAB04209.1 MAG TPA: glycine dehydrogenase (aminomethyl-transferring) [Candidatus Gastranaerophilales bacterium HUM_12]DAB05151.1 MAG TPA: glycine dehydrogenase (aminomethyl-tra